MGATRDQVLSRYGEPRSTVVGGGRELLFYPRERLTLRNGVVVEVERLPTEPVRRPTPPAQTPAPSPAPTTETTQPAAPAETTPPRTTPGNDAPSVRPAPAQPADAAPATAETAATTPPEPRVEIKRVLRPGEAAPSTTQQTAATTTAAGAAPVTGEAAKTPAQTPTKTATPTPTPAATTPVATTPATETTPAPTKAEEPETSKADDAAAAKALAKEQAKKQADMRAARRRLEEAQSDAVDPTATVFSTRTYVIALVIIGGGVAFLLWRRRQRQLELAATAVSLSPFSAPVPARAGAMFSAELIAKLEWKHFEELVAAYYSKTGVVATRTKAGPDAPVHIKISWKGEPRPFALVQCIAQPKGLIDAKPIQNLTAVLMAEDIRRGYVVTTGKFNVNARDFAEEKHITLLPGDIFLEKLNALPDLARTEIMQHVMTGDYTTPVCPKCEAKMVRSSDEPGVWRCAIHSDQQIAAR